MAKLTKNMIEKVAEYIQDGNFVAVACRKAGISRRTWYDWREKGEAARNEGKTRSVYCRFLEAIEEAEAIAEADLVAKVQETKRGALEILKRRFRQRWGDRVTTELTGPDGRPLEDAGSQNVEVHLHMEQKPGESAEPWNELGDEDADEVDAPKKRHDPLPLSPPPAS